jgi:DNA-binding transcriptional MocR family regulator
MSNHERKQWWAPVWTGLVVDEGAKHYRKMKTSVWLFLYLVLHANRRTGVLMRKVRTISRDMGITRDTTLRWLKLLRAEGYIVTVNTGRYLTIQVKNWKPLAKPGKMQPQKREASGYSSRKYPTPSWTPIPPVPVHFSPKPSVVAQANDTKIQIILNNNNMQHGITRGPDDGAFKSAGTCAWQELLAWDLARALDDPQGINLYRSYCRKYPEELLRKALADAREVPSHKIKKGRSALFNYLVQRYAQDTTENPGC